MSGPFRYLLLTTLLFGVLIARSLEAGTDLRKAYQREFAFLEAEKQSLKKRLAKIESENAAKQKEGQKEVDGLQGRVLALAAEADQMSEGLLDAERAADSSGDGADQSKDTSL